MDGNKIGVRIMQLRDERGESQEDVAKGIGESRETVRNWEVGTRKIKAESIVKLSEHFGVTSDYLLGLSNIKSPDVSVQAACELTGLAEGAILALAEYKDSPVDPSPALNLLLSRHEFFSGLYDVLEAIYALSYEAYYDSEEMLNARNALDNRGCVVLTGRQAADFYIQRATDMFRHVLMTRICTLSKDSEDQLCSSKP